jgi:hypothetical protein
MALIPTHSVTTTGTAPTFNAAAAGDTARVGAHMTLIVKNGAGAPITATITVPGNLPTGDAYPDRAYTVPAGGEQWIPLLDEYADPTTGQAAIAYSSTTTITRAVVKS